VLRARSMAEARLYMDLQPCSGCARRGFAEPGRLVEHGESLAVDSRGYCPRCGAARSFTLLLADERVAPRGFGNADASTLIDAGEWLLLAEELGTRVPAAAEALDREGRARARAELERALAALAEVVKVIPAGAERPPAAAFFSERGVQAHRDQPGRFTRTRLEATRQVWRALAARLAAE
jgi:hypothetical protein